MPQMRRRRLRISPLQIKQPHLFKVPFREPTAEAPPEVCRQPLQDLRAISGTLLATLFVLNDALTHQPIRRGKDCIDRLRGAAPTLL